MAIPLHPATSKRLPSPISNLCIVCLLHAMYGLLFTSPYCMTNRLQDQYIFDSFSVCFDHGACGSPASLASLQSRSRRCTLPLGFDHCLSNGLCYNAPDKAKQVWSRLSR